MKESGNEAEISHIRPASERDAGLTSCDQYMFRSLITPKTRFIAPHDFVCVCPQDFECEQLAICLDKFSSQVHTHQQDIGDYAAK